MRLAPFALAAALLASGATHARQPIIVVDPGHGGAQAGAEGPGGLKEKDVALAIARKLRPLLESAGAKVVFTRDSDVELLLSDRVARANAVGPDLFLSIHANSMPTQRLRARIQGVETFFLSASASGVDAASTADRENAEAPARPRAAASDTVAFILADLARTEAHVDSSRLAYAVHQKLVAATRAEDHGVQQAPFYVLNGLEAPAILIEVGYISHPAEGKRLGDPKYQDTLARAIADGVAGFLSQVRGRGAATAASASP